MEEILADGTVTIEDFNDLFHRRCGSRGFTSSLKSMAKSISRENWSEARPQTGNFTQDFRRNFARRL